jgi:hypothetical protein
MFCICFLVVIFFISKQGFASDNDVFRVLSEGYKKNRDSFPNMNCKFRFTWKAKADSIQQAIDYKYEITPKTVFKDGKLISKDRNTYFELRCSPEDKIITEKQRKEGITKKSNQQDSQKSKTDKKDEGRELSNNIVTVRCLDSVVLVSKDLYRLTYSESRRVANILPSGVEEGGIGIEHSPFDMGVMARNEYSNPHRYLQDCIRGRFSGKYEGTQEINGQQLEIVTFSTKDSNNQPSMKFGFDPKKGFLATYIADYDNKTHIPRQEAFITETKHCSGDRYFPMRSVVVYPENELYPINDGKYRINSFEVTELNVDTPPDSNLVQIELPKGAQVSVSSFKDQWLTVEEPLSITPQDIKQLQKNCIEYANAYIKKHTTPPEFEPAFKPNLQRGMWIKTILIVVGLILIVIGGRGIIRNMKNK